MEDLRKLVDTNRRFERKLHLDQFIKCRLLMHHCDSIFYEDNNGEWTRRSINILVNVKNGFYQYKRKKIILLSRENTHCLLYNCSSLRMAKIVPLNDSDVSSLFSNDWKKFIQRYNIVKEKLYRKNVKTSKVSLSTERLSKLQREFYTPPLVI